MYPIPPNEQLIETKTCKHCGVSFPITDKDLEFYDKVSPTFNEKRYVIPTPTLCPECRFQRRASFRNLRKLYKRRCDATGKDIISIYSPDKSLLVYHQDYWWSDAWDPMVYAWEFDFSRSFFEQFQELLMQVPKIALSTEKLENSDYVNYSGWVKNSYLVFISGYDEDCYYSHGIRYSEHSVDCSYSQYLNNCYSVSDSLECSFCHYLQDSKDCHHCFYSSNLTGCEYCLFCTNLSNTKYAIFNKRVSPEEFEKYCQDPHYIEENLKSYYKLLATSPRKQNFNILSENCTGEYALESQNVLIWFDISKVRDSKYVDWLFEANHCHDVYDWGETAENCYECYKIGKGVSKTSFSAFCIANIENLLYCYDCMNNCRDCFACVGVKNAKYCILNKQYTREEYEELVPKIISHMQKTGEWGEFFPAWMSPFGYNETVAQEYYPMTREEVVGDGEKKKTEDTNRRHDGRVFNWSDYESPFPKVEKIIPADKLPDDISKIPDDILNWAIECEVTKKPFRIIKQELEFYRKHNLPIPRRHPDQRHLDRMALRNPRKLYKRKCDKCGISMITTYSPERPEIVYCEECYNKDVIG